jgi:phage terminase large subunit-like protein
MMAPLDEFYFDERSATIAVNFFERLLRHSKGEWSGKPFTLLNWQKNDIIRPLFGWKRKSDNTRRYRTAYIEIPRKNGKSTISAGIALCLLYADGEPAAEIYSAAADRDQASIVFEEAKRMVDASPELQRRSNVYKRSIVVRETLSSYKVLSADAPTKHGLNAHGIIFDELHAQPNRELWDVLTTSTGARRQPLTVAITTAGYDRNSICWEQHEYARQVLSGVIEDPTFFAYIAAADETDDWTEEATWAKSNPSMGATVKLEYLQQECRKAQQSPAYQNTFRRLHLNQWTQQETRWLDLSAWDECGAPFNPKLLEGAACYGGLDLASTSDVASFVLCFPAEAGEDEHYTWLPLFWIPEENMVERARRDRVPYDAWARDGLIRVTPGNTIDYGYIVRDIEELRDVYDVREIAFDRWGAFQVSQQLDGVGFTMIGFGQGFASMSGPTKELLRIVLDGRLRHGGHKVLRWMADNVVVSTDPAGNVKPNKQKSREKIDGIVAGIMALDRALRNQSVYDSRGMLSL